MTEIHGFAGDYPFFKWLLKSVNNNVIMLDLCRCLFKAFDVIKSKHYFLFVSTIYGQVIQNATNDYLVEQSYQCTLFVIQDPHVCEFILD